MPIASSRPLCTSTWRPFAMSHSQQELGQHAQALGAMSHSPPLRTQLPSSCGPYIWIIQTCFNLIIFSNHGFKYKCKNWWLIHSRHTSTAKVSTRWKWARWPDPVMCSYIDVTPHCNIQPHSPGCTWEEMTRGCGLDNVQPVKRRDITKAVLHTGDRHKDWKRSVAEHFATSQHEPSSEWG